LPEVSPFRRFDREEWSKLRADTPMTLTQVDLDELRGLNDKIDLAEVETIYLPLSRLLNLYVAATQKLFRATNSFLHSEDRKVPYVIGIAGSVPSARHDGPYFRRLLSRWPHHPKLTSSPPMAF
jgi:type I pantothenate kinase